MATQRTNITTSLKIKVENGTTESGAIKYATRTFRQAAVRLKQDMCRRS